MGSYLFLCLLQLVILVNGHFAAGSIKPSSSNLSTSTQPSYSCQASLVNRKWPIKATAVFMGPQIVGQVNLTQESPRSLVRLDIDIRGLTPGQHGFHVHEFGISNGCNSAGPHFNPTNSEHGAWSDPKRHVGDLQPLTANPSGFVIQSLTDRLIILTGPNSILGRTMVIHKNPDDFGRGTSDDSKKTGSAGERIACAMIGHRM